MEDLDLRHVAEALTQAADEGGVDLDRPHAPAAAGQLGGQRAGAGADVQDEVVLADAGVADDLGREARRAEEVLCVATP